MSVFDAALMWLSCLLFVQLAGSQSAEGKMRSFECPDLTGLKQVFSFKL